MEKLKCRRRVAETSESFSSVRPKNLPMYLITDILSRLPVKSLSRFKSVSKPWHSLIQSTNFINLHLKFSKLNPNPIFSSILSLVETSEDKYVFRLNLIHALDKPIEMDFPFMSGTNYCLVLGISDGLLCLMFRRERSRHIIVCNPVTGNFRRIPPSICESSCDRYSFFGFSSNEDAFELVSINYQSSSIKASSFSSRVNAWKNIEVKMGSRMISTKPIFLHPLNSNRLPVFKDGVFYWKGNKDGRACIVFLDLFNEMFDVIPAPDDTHYDELGLIIFKEQIMVVKLVNKEYDLWMLNENDKTWRMFKSIDVFGNTPVNYLVIMLGCTGNGKLVLRRRYYSNVELYLYKIDNDDSNRYYSNSELCLYDIDNDDSNILTYVNVEVGCGMYLFAESLATVETGDFGNEV